MGALWGRKGATGYRRLSGVDGTRELRVVRLSGHMRALRLSMSCMLCKFFTNKEKEEN